ncbi:MAG: Fe-Mn family superoxide dismutase [Vicinamibacteria bacterium]
MDSSTPLTRRQALATAAALAPAIATAQAPAPAAEAAPKPSPFQIKPLPFDPAKLTGLSERLLRSHWENNYAGAIRALNNVRDRLVALRADRDTPSYLYGDVKREELIRRGSMVLHELYFANLGGSGRPGGGLADALKNSFGSAEAWEDDFRKTAASLYGGSGWTVLAWNQHTHELHNYWASDHSQSAVMGTPLLVLDLYEHAYHIDFGAAASRYVDAFFANVHWDEVQRRLESARKP